jgi:hypothetical protein
VATADSPQLRTIDRPPETGPPNLPVQNRQLVAEHNDLEFFEFSRAEQERDKL